MELRVLHVIPYESSRKRMSMVVQMPDGSILLYCKGADSIMLELQDPAINSSRFVENLACQVSDWAEEAFRTMVFGYKPLTQEAVKDMCAELARSYGYSCRAQKSRPRNGQAEILQFRIHELLRGRWSVATAQILRNANEKIACGLPGGCPKKHGQRNRTQGRKLGGGQN